MKVLHLLASGGIGGIEILCKNIIINADWDNRICCLFEDGQIYEELKKNNYNVFSLKDKKRKIKEIVKSLEKYCIEEKIDIVTVHHGGASCNIIYILLKRRLPNLKYVRYLHGSYDKYTFGNGKNRIKNKIIKIIMQKALSISNLNIFISNAVLKSFNDNFKNNKDKSIVIYNGIDNKFYQKELKLNKMQNEKVKILYVGRLAKVKGIDILIEACSKLKNKNYELTIVGEGKEKENIEKLIDKLGLKDKVKLVGRQNNVEDWLDDADIFVYPSIWEEGFGISVVEAMSRGCIAVTFKRGGLPEIIQNNVNGFIAKDGNENLANQIDIIMNMPKDRISEISNNAIKTAKKFNGNNTIAELKKAYEKI